MSNNPTSTLLEMASEGVGDALRIHARELLAAVTTTLSNGTTPTNEKDPVSTIADYATDLNGVNQPMNNLFKVVLWWSLGIVAMATLVIRMFQRWKAHSRHIAAMSRSKNEQRFWAINKHESWWKFKKHVLYAPLAKKRHNREMRLSSALNMGTVPSRFHFILLTGFVLSNIGYIVALNYHQPDHYGMIAELRGRSGVLAVVNMIALIILAGRNNPLIQLLQISFDTYNLVHRWMGRTVIIESIIHTCAWGYVKHAAAGWSGIWNMIATDSFISWGTVSTAAMIIIFVTALSPVRHAFYETFLDIHIILAFFAILGIWIHCGIANLPQLPYIKTVFVLWLLDRAARMARLVWYNYSRRGWTTASIEALPGDACRVTLHLPRKANINAGSHAYLRFATINAWESHPFSIAWVEDRSANHILPTYEKVDGKQVKASETVSDVSFVIHSQTGLTKRLFQKANARRSKILTLKAAFEGPYAGHHSLDSYGHAILFAGSSGITHQIPFVKHLITGFKEKSIVTRKILLVWIVRDSEHLEWVRPWMDEILKMQGRKEILRIKLFVTRPKNPRQIVSPSTTVQMFPGRPNVQLLVQNEVKEQTGAMCVTVCGPGGLADNVREAVRDVQEFGVVDFIEESFTW